MTTYELLWTESMRAAQQQLLPHFTADGGTAEQQRLLLKNIPLQGKGYYTFIPAQNTGSFQFRLPVR